MQTGEDAEADGRERQIGAGARHAAPRPHAVSEQGEVAGLGIKGKNMQLVLSYKPTSLGKTAWTTWNLLKRTKTVAGIL